MNRYSPKVRRVEEAEAGFTNAAQRVVNWDAKLKGEGLHPDQIAENLGRQAMVNTAREYAIDYAVAQAFDYTEVRPRPVAVVPLHSLTRAVENVQVAAEL